MAGHALPQGMVTQKVLQGEELTPALYKVGDIRPLGGWVKQTTTKDASHMSAASLVVTLPSDTASLPQQPHHLAITLNRSQVFAQVTTTSAAMYLTSNHLHGKAVLPRATTAVNVPVLVVCCLHTTRRMAQQVATHCQ